MVLRLCLDINVFYSEYFSRSRRVFPSAASDLVDWVDSGNCPAGPVQLVISWPMVEQWKSVLIRHLHIPKHDAEAISSSLAILAMDGPVSESPHMILGSGFVPFATDEEIVSAAKALKVRRASDPENSHLYDEVEDDRIVYLTALVAGADVLVTDNMKDFRRGSFQQFERDDLIIVTHGNNEIVVATPFFVAKWLKSGVPVTPEFIRSRPDLFAEKSKDSDHDTEPK